MGDKTYAVNEVFYSLQGEGINAGRPAVFVRFAGCNLKCLQETHGFDCDTEFMSGRKLTADEIAKWMLDEALAAGLLGKQRPLAILTGGEPGLQIDKPFCANLRSLGWELAIETNGTIDLTDMPLDWITVSPKVAEHAIKQTKADEVKYVRGYGQPIPRTVVEADHYLISPAFNGLEPDERAVAWCCKLVKENPEWRLSMQLHKILGVR